jgi:hypothetical protein
LDDGALVLVLVIRVWLTIHLDFEAAHQEVLDILFFHLDRGHLVERFFHLLESAVGDAKNFGCYRKLVMHLATVSDGYAAPRLTHRSSQGIIADHSGNDDLGGDSASAIVIVREKDVLLGYVFPSANPDEPRDLGRDEDLAATKQGSSSFIHRIAAFSDGVKEVERIRVLQDLITIPDYSQDGIVIVASYRKRVRDDLLTALQRDRMLAGCPS